jgi:hypothetical protein
MQPDPNVVKYSKLFGYIHHMNMRNVRDVYRGIREFPGSGPDVLFPRLGITAGEFAAAYVVKVPRRCAR